jgi:hypothetical protein
LTFPSARNSSTVAFFFPLRWLHLLHTANINCCFNIILNFILQHQMYDNEGELSLITRAAHGITAIKATTIEPRQVTVKVDETRCGVDQFAGIWNHDYYLTGGVGKGWKIVIFRENLINFVWYACDDMLYACDFMRYHASIMQNP